MSIDSELLSQYLLNQQQHEQPISQADGSVRYELEPEAPGVYLSNDYAQHQAFSNSPEVQRMLAARNSSASGSTGFTDPGAAGMGSAFVPISSPNTTVVSDGQIIAIPVEGY